MSFCIALFCCFFHRGKQPVQFVLISNTKYSVWFLYFTVSNSAGWAVHISWRKCCLQSVWGFPRAAQTEALHTETCNLVILMNPHRRHRSPKLGQSGLLIWSKSAVEKLGVNSHSQASWASGCWFVSFCYLWQRQWTQELSVCWHARPSVTNCRP